MFRLVAALSILISSIQPVWAAGTGNANDGLHVLKGRVIRSLAIDTNDPAHVLVGHKAKAPGSALVFQSLDKGKSWRTLNGNKPLHPDATDVQAVLPVSKDILLGGTWKQGLYRSSDGGRTFNRIHPFPSSDIRDLQMADGSIYAATARHGVFESRDQGISWTTIGPGQDFLWSMTLADGSVFASSPEGSIYERPERDATWHKVFQGGGANAIAVTPGSGGLRAIAGAKGLYFSAPSGWRKIFEGENFADIIITRNNRIIAGSWDNGIAVLTSGGNPTKRILKGTPVVHVQMANHHLYAGTWGDGLHILPMAHALSRTEPDTPLIAAVLSDNLAKVRRLVDAGADIDAHDKARNTALIFAARDGQLEIAQTLIKAGADPGWIDGEGVTPLILGAFKNHPEIVKLLLKQKQKVRINHKDKWRRTALEYAKRRGIEDPIYKWLIR